MQLFFAGEHHDVSGTEPGLLGALRDGHARAIQVLERELNADCEMTLAEYDVLNALADANGHHLRMSELAEQVCLSPSGLTRRLDALARGGLVTREHCDDDLRGVFATITERGRRVTAAAATYTRVEQQFSSQTVTPEDQAIFEQVLSRARDAE